MPKAINPDHYSQMAIEPIDVIESCHMDYHVASAVAYLMRGGRKGDAVDDYKKALNFLHRRIYGTWFTEPCATELDESVRRTGEALLIDYANLYRNDGADGETP